MASEIPAGLVLGSLQVSLSSSLVMSKVISFPFASALVLPQGNAEQNDSLIASCCGCYPLCHQVK
jgi:hypothetical protein